MTSHRPMSPGGSALSITLPPSRRPVSSGLVKLLEEGEEEEDLLVRVGSEKRWLGKSSSSTYHPARPLLLLLEARLTTSFFRFSSQTAHSRNPTLIHDPRLGHVASFALSYPLPAPSSTASKLSSTKALHHESTRPPTLLTASLLHGVCSRSEPLSGKVLKGYISDRSTTNDPTGAGGLGLPSVTAMLLKEKDSSRILWGYVDGEVAVTSLVPGGGGKNLPKGVRSRGFGRIGARSTAHGGAVRTLAGGKELFAFASGGDDGTVKLWREAGSVSMRDERLECIWTGQVAEDRQKDQSMLGMPRDAIAKVCWDGSSLGCVTASGEVRVWIGFSNGEGEGRQRSLPDGEPIVRWRMPGEGENYRGFGGVGFEMDSTLSPQSLSFLVHLADSSSFIKLSISFPSSISPPDPSSLDPTVTAIIFRSQTDDLLSLPLTAFFTDFALPPTISLPFAHRSTPLASRPPSEPSTPSVSSSNVFHLPNTIESQEPIKRQGALGSSPYVVAGDAEGFVRVWAWNASPIQPSFSSPTLPVAGKDDAGQQSSQMLPFVLPIRDFLASPYNANSTAPPSSSKITFLTCSSSLLLVGTLEGSILIYDPLPPTTAMNGSPTLLRSFNERRAGRNLTRHLAAGELDPSLWQVSQITLERDLLVAAVGARILGWRIGDRRERDGKSPFKGKVLGRKAVSNGGGGGKSSGARSGHSTLPSSQESQASVGLPDIDILFVMLPLRSSSRDSRRDRFRPTFPSVGPSLYRASTHQSRSVRWRVGRGAHRNGAARIYPHVEPRGERARGGRASAEERERGTVGRRT
jgi:hypothetical protein